MPSKLSSNGEANWSKSSPSSVSTASRPLVDTSLASNSRSSARTCCQTAGPDNPSFLAAWAKLRPREISTSARICRRRTSL